MERLQQVIQPSTITQSNKYKKDLITYRQTIETFSQFFVELKRRYDLAKDELQIPMQGTQHMQGVHRQDEARRLNVLYLYRC